MTAPMTPGQLVGQRVRRREDPRLVQGLGSFVDDIKLPGMLHLAFKRSDVAHGIIRSIDTSAAEALPGVELVMTGAQLAEVLPPMPVVTVFPFPEHHSVTPDKVRYVGEPVAVVVASDRFIARDAADLIELDIEELPAVIDPETAMTGEPAILHDDFENNLAVPLLPNGTGVDPETLEVDDTAIDEAFANAEVVISERMVNQRLVPNAIETRGIVASWEPGPEKLTVWTSTQNPHIDRTLISALLGLGQHQVRVIAGDVGGAFGSKINVYGEDFVACLISRRLERPVKWIEDRSEAFMTTTHGRDIIGYIDLAAKRDGTLLGLKMRLIADLGAYEMLLTAANPTFTMFMLSGVYNIPAARADLTEVFTNKMPTDAYRGAGRPEGMYFVERAMDMLARELEMDPAELRRKNFIAPDQFPYTTATGMVYDSGNYEPTLDKALENAGWEQMKADRDAARAAGRLVGLGLIFYTEICGFGPSAAGPPGVGLWEFGNVTVTADGKVVGATGASSHGQGHETSFAQLLADQFGVPIEDISIVHGDTDVVKAGVGTFGSRSIAVGGTALGLAGDKVKEKMMRYAAHMIEARADDLVFADGQIYPAGSPDAGVAFAEVAALAYDPKDVPADIDPGLSEEAFWEPEGFTWPFGCYISQVEIDRDTGEIDLQRFVGVDDCGNIINPMIVAGQIHGGIAQGVGQAMIEEAVYDADGQLVTGSLLDYALPRARDFPRFELDHTTTPSPLNPMGVKGIGEAGTIGSTPCIVNAVVDALSEFGVRHIDMMLRPEKLWRVIHGGES